MKKSIQFLLIIIFMFLDLSQSKAGGQVGNGGLGVTCGPDKTIKVLDFYEAEQKFKLIDLSKFKTREDFFEFIFARMEKAKNDSFNQSLIAVIKKRLIKFGEISSWPEASAVRTYDEILGEDLPKDCKTVQLAVYENNFPHKIKLTVDQLGFRQSWILELHEALYSTGFETVETQTNSAPTKRFISYLLKENVAVTTLELEARKYMDPGANFKLIDRFLDFFHFQSDESKRGKTALTIWAGGYTVVGQNPNPEVCPKWLALVPSAGIGSHFYGYFETENKNWKTSFELRPGTTIGTYFTTRVKINKNFEISARTYFRFTRKANDNSESMKVKVYPADSPESSFVWNATMTKTDVLGTTTSTQASCEYEAYYYSSGVRTLLKELDFKE